MRRYVGRIVSGHLNSYSEKNMRAGDDGLR